ncbi:MAG: hypothetical protein ACI4PO_03615, partial [Faecousia sp.]
MRCAEKRWASWAERQNPLRLYGFSETAEWAGRGEKVGVSSTFFPLLFHLWNLENRCGSRKIRFASTT